MITSIKQWLAPPIFEGDEEKTLRASLLNAGAITVSLFSSLVIVGNFLGGRTPINTTLINILAISIGFLLRHWLHRGKIKVAGTVLLVFGFILITGAIISLGTIRTPTTTDYLLFVIMAGVLFDLRGTLIATVASSLAVAGLILAENAGLLPQPDYTVTITQWFVYTLLFGTTGYLSFFTLTTTRKTLARAENEIAERKRVEMELRKLTRAVEQSPASIALADLDGNIEYVNPRFTQVTGYRFDEVRGKNPRILKTDLTPPETYRQLWDTVTAGKEWHGEFINKKKDGSLYYESAIISPITDLNGVNTHYLAVKEDITERKQAEQSLHEMRSRLHLLGENLEEAALYVYSHDPEGRAHFEYLSAGMEKLTGVKAEDILQDAACLLAVILPEYMPVLAELEANSKKNLTSFEMEVRQRNAVTGKIHWALLRSTPRRRPDGTTVWYGVQMNITERKTNEKLLEKAIEQLNQQNEYLSNLHQITIDLLSRKETQTLLNNIAQYAISLVNAQHGYIFLPDDNSFLLCAATGEFAHNIGNREPKPGAGVLGHVWQSKETVIVENYSEWKFRDPNYESEDLRAIAGVPIKIGDNVIGVLEVANTKASHIFTGEEIQILSRFATLAALVLYNAQLLDSTEYEITERKYKEAILQRHVAEVEHLQSELREQALRDPLTGLHNRRYLSESIEREIERAKRENSQLSVIVSDIDHFKLINDTYGHQVGDQFLTEIACLMKKHARSSDIVCRYGGEEFLLVLPGTTLASAAKRAEEIKQRCVEIIIQHEEKNLKVTMSFGVATYPAHGKEAEEVIIKADKALYRSKYNGRNQVTVWDNWDIQAKK